MAMAGQYLRSGVRRLARVPLACSAAAPARAAGAPQLAAAALTRQTRGIVDAQSTGQVMLVDKEHSSAFMFGRERQLLVHVVDTAREGDVKAVLGAMDSFWAEKFSGSGAESWSMRGDVIDKVMQSKAPNRCLEIGTYCGYSALRMAEKMPEGSLLVSVEVDPLFAAIATKIVEHAGLANKVKILMGTTEQQADRISKLLAPAGASTMDKPVDVILCDHSKELFVPDLKLLEQKGIVGPGTTVMGDTTVYPGDKSTDPGQDLLSYFASNPSYRVAQHVGTQKAQGITVSEWVHLP